MAEKVIIDIDVETSNAINGLKNFSDSLGKMARQVKEEEEKLASLRKEFKASKNPSDELSAAFAEQTAKLKLLKNAYNEAEKGATGLRGFTDKLKDGFTDGAGSVLAFTSVAGVASAAIAKLGSAIIETNSQVTDLQREAEFLFDKPAEDARKLATEVVILGKNFDQDVNEVLKTTNVLAKQFGISAEESLNLVSQGLEKGGKFSDDFLSQLQEYPTQLAAVGLSAEQSIAILTTTIKDGVFSDKGLDSIKEAGLRLRELPQSTKDALEGIGLGKLPEEIKNGTKTTFEAIQQISGKLGELPPQSQAVGSAIADIFGGAGEDAGKFIFSLQNINTNLADLPSTLSATEQAQNRLNEAFTNLITTSGDGNAFFAAIVDGAAALVESLDDIFSSVGDTFSEVFGVLNELAEAFGLVNEQGESTISFSGYLKASMEGVIIPIEALGKTLVLATRSFIYFVDLIKSGLNELIDILPESFADSLGLKKFDVDLEESGKKVAESFNGIVTYVQDKPKEIADAFLGTSTSIKNSAKKTSEEIDSSISKQAGDAAAKIVSEFKKSGKLSTKDIDLLAKEQAKVIAESFSGVAGFDSKKADGIVEQIKKQVSTQKEASAEEIDAINKRREAGQKAAEAAAKQQIADKKAVDEFILVLQRKNEAQSEAIKNDEELTAKAIELRKKGLDDQSIALAIEQEKIIQNLEIKKQSVEQEFSDKIKGKKLEKEQIVKLEEEKAESISLLEAQAANDIEKTNQRLIDGISKYADALRSSTIARAADTAGIDKANASRQLEFDILSAKTKALSDGKTIVEATAIADKVASEGKIKLQEEEAARELEITKKKLDDELKLKLESIANEKAAIAQAQSDGVISATDAGAQTSALDATGEDLTGATNEAKLQAELEFQTALTQIQLDGELERANIETKAAEEEAARKEARVAVLAGFGQQVAATLGEAAGAAIAGAENANKQIEKRLLLGALDSLKALIPIAVGQITAKLIAANPLLGGIAAAGLSGVLFGLLNTAKAGVAKFSEGGEVFGAGTGTSDSIPAMLSRGEFVIRASVAEKNKDFLKALNSGEVMTPQSSPVAQMQNSVNELYNSIKANKDTTPLQAIVSESEITRSQKRVQKFESNSLL